MNSKRTATILISFFISVSALFFNCEQAAKKNNGEIKAEEKKVIFESTESKHYSNPVLIYGSSFGNFFQQLYKIGKFEDMLRFTSARSVQKYGSKDILNTYKKMDFGYQLKLKSKIVNADSTITLNYETQIMATKGVLRMTVCIENDTVKLILKNSEGKNIFD